MLAILDLIDAIVDWKKFTSKKRTIRRRSRGFVANYYR